MQYLNEIEKQGGRKNKCFGTLSVSTKILMAFLSLTLIFTITSGYSLLKHHTISSNLRLISQGYLKIAFAVVEIRTTQRLLIVHLNNISEGDLTFTKNWVSSVRRMRPIVLESLEKDVNELLKTHMQEGEKEFLVSLKKEINQISSLYLEAEKYHTALMPLLENELDPSAIELVKVTKEIEEKIGRNLRHLQNISIQRINMVTARSEQVERRTVWMLGALVLLTLSIGFIATYFIHRLLMPLAEIRRGVEIIGKGNLDYRIKVRKLDEIGRFAHQLNIMAQELQERDRQLILSERLAGIGKMASHIAHEIKNPLSSIGLNTELAIDEANQIMPEEKKEEILSLLRSILQEVERMRKLIDHYLQMGKPPKMNKTQTDLSALIEEVKGFMEHEMQEAGVEVNLHLPQESIMAKVDRDQIKQVMINLMKNAIEAMDKTNRKIDVILETNQSSVNILVKDTGRGMKTEEKEKIFEPFYTNKPSGSGLGLAITRQIICDHKGTIECTSFPGQGTTFKITIPVEAD